MLASFFIVWCLLSFPNYFILKEGNKRLGTEEFIFLDYALLIILSIYGPVGVLFHYAFMEWWCSAFEPPKITYPNQEMKQPAAQAIVVSSTSWTGR